MQIRNKILKVEPSRWREFQFLQTDRLKRFPPELEAKLRESLIANDFVTSFKVWEQKGVIYCLDGYHRCRMLKALEERGYSVPDELPAEFIECKNKSEAAKLVLVYSSHYTEVSKSDLNAFITEHGLSIDRLSDEINILFSRGLGGTDGEDEEELRGECEYPIAPKFSENYDYVIIFCKNSVDFANLNQALKLETEKSYKNTAVGVSRVIDYDTFMRLWKHG